MSYSLVVSALIQCNKLEVLHKDSLLSLAALSKEYNVLIAPFVSNLYYFNLYPQEQFKFYQPHKLIIHNPHFLSTISALPPITHIKFGSFYDYSSLDPLPQSLTHLYFGPYFTNHMPLLPFSLTHISIGPLFKGSIHILPPLTHLDISSIFCETIHFLPDGLLHLDCPENTTHTCSIPASIKSLSYSGTSRPYLIHYLNITHIKFGNHFNKSVEGLPPALTHLTFGDRFNQSVDSLPNTLIYLFFGYLFNSSIDRLPPQLQFLKFPIFSEFNLPIKSLPPTLKQLHFGDSLAHPVQLPPNLTHLRLHFCHDITALPSSLTHLTLINSKSRTDEILGQVMVPLPNITELDLTHYWCNRNKLDVAIPATVTTLYLPEMLAQLTEIHLPPMLTHLTFGSAFNEPLPALPASLIKLTFGLFFTKQVNHLPTSLTHLSFSRYYNQPVNHLPPHVTHITFGPFFDQCIDDLPASVENLVLDANFNQPVDSLPRSLKSLQLGESFNQSIDKLPDFLRRLHIESLNFNLPIRRLPSKLHSLQIFDSNLTAYLNVLPSSLRVLTIMPVVQVKPSALQRLSAKFKKPHRIKSLPLSLVHLSLPGYYYKDPTNTFIRQYVPPALHHLLMYVPDGYVKIDL